MVKDRKIEISASSVIFMLLVIFIHTAADAVSSYRTESTVFVMVQSLHRLSSFVVQGFIFLSGLKLFLPSDKPFSYKKFYLSRFTRVVLPYILIYSVFYLYIWKIGYVNPSFKHFITEMLTGGLIGHFYFVAVICQFYILIPLWRWMSKKDPMLVLPVCLILMIVFKTAVPEAATVLGHKFELNARMFWSYLFYFAAGVFAGKNYARFKELLVRSRWGMLALFVVVGAIDCVNIVVIRRGEYYPSWAENFHVLYCVAAVFVVMSFSLMLSETKIIKAIEHTDRASYNIYLIHPLFIYMADRTMGRYGVSSVSLRFVIRTVAVYVISIGVCLIYEYVKGELKKRIRAVNAPNK